MTDAEDNQQQSYVHYPKVSMRTTIADSKPMVQLSIFMVVATFAAVFVSGFFTPFFFRNFGIAALLIFDFAFGFCFCGAALLVVKEVIKQTSGRHKTKLLALESKVLAGTVPLTLDEIHSLIENALKSNHRQVADFYSKQVMALSMLGEEKDARSIDWMLSTDCWASTDEFNKSWTKKLWSPYESRVVFSLGTTQLALQTKKFSFECKPSQITGVEVKLHPRFVKPFPAKYIYLTIDDDGFEHSFVITPSSTIADTVWEANRMVDQWVEHIAKARKNSSNFD